MKDASGFNQLTGNSGANPWSIGFAKFDFLNLTLFDVSVEPILSGKSISALTGFVADPFYFDYNGNEYVFYESWNNLLDRGEIGVSKYSQGVLTDHNIILSERFHLSYPNVFYHSGSFYMLPEAWESGKLILYRAVHFPYKWEQHKVLLTLDYADPQLFFHENMWYLFLTNDPLTNRSMSIYFAEKLTGPWLSHTLNPIYENMPSISRSAGKLFTYQGLIIRFAQDCSLYYGQRITAQIIRKLSPTIFEEEALGVVAVENHLWNQTACHQLDVFKKGDSLFAFFDGYTAICPEFTNSSLQKTLSDDEA